MSVFVSRGCEYLDDEGVLERVLSHEFLYLFNSTTKVSLTILDLFKEEISEFRSPKPLIQGIIRVFSLHMGHCGL